jgi:isopenicillin N synthase-like dioxygenase
MSDLIPLIDFSPFFSGPAGRQSVGAAVFRAAHETGFMYLKGHGIPFDHVSETFGLAQDFFRLPSETKVQHLRTAGNFGYQSLAQEALDPTQPPDLKEDFTMRNALAIDASDPRWPSEAFRSKATGFYDECRKLAAQVMQAFAQALRLPEGFFDDKHTGKTQTLRFLHYPPSRSVRPGQLGAGAHTDYGTLTLLFQDNAGGLEVQNTDGLWVPAPPMPGTVVVNTGDLLARWSNDVLRSTPHRVQIRPESAAAGRLSIAFFSDPDPEVLVETIPSCITADRPARHAPILAGAHIEERIRISMQQAAHAAQA